MNARRLYPEVQAALAAPFDPNEVKWKPQTVKGERALAVAYVDARVVMERLDDVVGANNWQDEYTHTPDGGVVCRLSIRFSDDENWISKMDTGGESDQPDGDDKRKSAFSDALKRAAVKFGIGRYLYRLPHQWADFDPVKKTFKSIPQLPDWAKTRTSPHAKKAAPAQARTASDSQKPGPPKTGAELLNRLTNAGIMLHQKGIGAGPLEIIEYVKAVGNRAGYHADIASWDEAGIDLGVRAGKEYMKEKGLTNG